VQVIVIGLGFVGLTLGLALAENGVIVNGIETNAKAYQSISKGIATFNEKGIHGFFKRNLGKRLKIYPSLEELPKNSKNTFIICVGTPLENQNPVMTHLQTATESVGKYMSTDDLVIVRSTIPVGTTRKFVKPILENELKRRNLSNEINLVFAPERTAEGVALKELTELPQIVGGINENSIIRAMDLFRKLTPIVIQVSSPEAAEMIKLIDNSFRDVRFAYANEISLLCEQLGVDAFECITKSNIHYPRNNVPTPSPGVGGPCLSKDSYILLSGNANIKKLFPKLESLVLAGRNLNESMPKLLVNKIRNVIPINKENSKNTKVFIMGFAFKGNPETNDIRYSPTLSIVEELKDDFKLHGHDYVVQKDEIKNLGVIPTDLEEGFKDANCVIIVNNHKNYQNLDILSLLNTASKPCLFVDCWRIFDKKLFENSDVIYSGVGIV